MKKNFTKYAGIAMVALLTACNGSTITKEEAAKVARGITEHQVKDENLYKTFHMVSKISGFDDNGKAANIITEVWFDAKNDFIHVKLETPDENNEKIIKSEAYMGKIGEKYYSIDMGEKQYTEFENKSQFDIVFTQVSSSTRGQLVSTGSGAMLEMMIANTSDDPKEGEEVVEFKSKGEGHLYVCATKTEKDDDTEITTKAVMIFDNYVLSSAETTITDKKDSKNNLTTSAKVDYNVNAKMPSLNGLTKAE